MTCMCSYNMFNLVIFVDIYLFYLYNNTLTLYHVGLHE